MTTVGLNADMDWHVSMKLLDLLHFSQCVFVCVCHAEEQSGAEPYHVDETRPTDIIFNNLSKIQR